MDKKNQILNAAYELFAEKGYSLSMSEIAEIVKIKTPSLYSHFKSKDEIIEIIIKTEIEHCFDTIHKKAQKLKDKSCEERLKNILFHTIEYCDKGSHLRFWRNMSLLENKELRNMSSTFIQERDNCLVDNINSCFEKGIKDKEIKDTVNEGQVYLYFSMIQGILNSTLLIQDNSISTENFASMAWDAYWDGIKA
ncbi:TetR/AcrR family transcriptional regulator [Aminipila sp.]|uniref:TetR/AcrR family transcriptional regulator n=1 Tax=Aminipila sp. TaxID=2060095 RepID=UPI00289EE8F8|nr:TetR/AcrR family transcriptional regulator [Aminipila sp.]